MTETDLMHEIMLAVSKLGHPVFRVNVGKVKTTDGRWFNTGLPKGHSDLYGVEKGTGRCFYIEVKVSPNKPTDEQVQFLTAMRKFGALGCVAYSVSEALQIFDSKSVMDVFGDVILEDPAALMLPNDSDAWFRLLESCYVEDGELYKILHTIRAKGAVLEPDDDFCYKIVPKYDIEEYKTDSVMLHRYRNFIVKKLKELKK
jgi:hypothetical protein